MVDGEQVDRITALIPHLAVMGFVPEVSGGSVALRSCPLIIYNHQPRDLVCIMHEDLFRAVVGLDPAAYGRLRFLSSGPDDYQISPAQSVGEEPDLKIAHTGIVWVRGSNGITHPPPLNRKASTLGMVVRG